MANVSIRLVDANKVKIILDQYEKDVRMKGLSLCRQIASEVHKTADAEYGGYEAYDPGDYVDVETEEIEEGARDIGYRVFATGNEKVAQDGTVGNTVMFAEFGAGTMASEHPSSEQFGAYPDSWSSHDFREFHSWGHWYHNGKLFTKVRPTMAMFKGAMKARSVATELIYKIFGRG